MFARQWGMNTLKNGGRLVFAPKNQVHKMRGLKRLGNAGRLMLNLEILVR